MREKRQLQNVYPSPPGSSDNLQDFCKAFHNETKAGLLSTGYDIIKAQDTELKADSKKGEDAEFVAGIPHV